MSGKIYLKNRLPFLVMNLLAMIALFVFLQINGNSRDTVLLILVVWAAALSIGMLAAYRRRKAYLEKLLAMTEKLQERYLIAEVMEESEFADDQVYAKILKLAEKSMLEQIEAVRRERKEYKEYIEQWVHEIKTPITAMKLFCENHRSELTRELLPLLEKTDRCTEQALYYARSEQAQKDYRIKEINPFEAVHQSIADNKYLLMQNDVRIQVDEEKCTVYSDEKWLRFLLNQLIANAVKYRTQKPILHIYTECEGNVVNLYVADNGIGIAASDLPRIFEKGFTGQNGRMAGQNSTGIGLYLCKRLCDKLGIGISALSGEDGTTMRLSFHINDFCSL